MFLIDITDFFAPKIMTAEDYILKVFCDHIFENLKSNLCKI